MVDFSPHNRVYIIYPHSSFFTDALPPLRRQMLDDDVQHLYTDTAQSATALLSHRCALGLAQLRANMLRANDDVLIMCHTSPGVRFVAPGLAVFDSKHLCRNSKPSHQQLLKAPMTPPDPAWLGGGYAAHVAPRIIPV
ncbi:hypothetical protein AFLA_010223 [Aspergillus flavus NRRL3357]|nr:hypothetical protein AFLA_010223 [Aspergillus flavus NRRL3357]